MKRLQNDLQVYFCVTIAVFIKTLIVYFSNYRASNMLKQKKNLKLFGK